jgi:hypothetical protein
LTRIFDDLGHEVDGDADPRAAHGCRHTHTLEYRKTHRAANKNRKLKERPMEEIHQGTDAPPHAEPATLTHESLGIAAFDLSKVIPEGGTLSPLALTLGGLAIFGGVALKVVPTWLRGRTEMATQRLALKAKRMELEQKSKEQQQSGDCVSRHAACLAAIATLEERVKLVERQADGLMGEVASAKDEATKLSLAGRGSVDEDRLHQLEKRVVELSNKVCKTDAE